MLLLSPPLPNRVTMKSFQWLIGTTPAVTVEPIVSGCSPVLLPAVPASAAIFTPMMLFAVPRAWNCNVPPARVTPPVPNAELEFEMETTPLLIVVPPP